jgi:hypothetical protein
MLCLTNNKHITYWKELPVSNEEKVQGREDAHWSEGVPDKVLIGNSCAATINSWLMKQNWAS